MAKAKVNDSEHERIQQAGRNLLVYVFSLMKTGEVHELHNEAWIRPIDKLTDALQELYKIERQTITLVLSEGVAQINSNALWLDQSTHDAADELEKWLARREAGGIIFSEKPPVEEIKKFFFYFARFRTPSDAKEPMTPFVNFLEQEEKVTQVRLAARPLRLEGVGRGVRGVPSLWFYSKGAAGLEEVLYRSPVEVKAARRVAQELVDVCAQEQDFLVSLPILSTGNNPARRAMDVAVLLAAVGRGLGLSALRCAELTLSGLLHEAGVAYANPDPTEFTASEVACTLIVHQLTEGSSFNSELARRVATSIEYALGAKRDGPPYLVGAPAPSLDTQLVSLARRYLELLHPAKGEACSPLKAGLVLLEDPTPLVDSGLTMAFVGAIGLLPVGAVVELHNGDLAVVSEVDHIRGREVYDQVVPPVSRPRRVYVERMRTARGQVVPERNARVLLGADDGKGEVWRVARTLKRDGLQDLAVRALLRRPSTVVAQMGLRG